MSVKWTGNRSESGILRKSEFKEKKEELFVFGYSCKLFRDNEKALHIDQGKHLIPWMGDESLKIDRYDARGALHDLSSLEAPPGGYDWRVELTKAELDVEQLCDEERYRALRTDEDEEEMYKEEELKRLHAAGYGQVGFNYDAPKEQETLPLVEVEEPFLPSVAFKALLPEGMVLPETLKQNAIIEKTAKFIANQGTQMEILIKAKQRDNPQFKFLNKDSELNAYYTVLIGLVKAGTWPEKKIEVVEEKPPEPDEYLHPSLASTIIESAPSIPSIQYRPSADCDYTMLVSKMRGESALDEPYSELAPGEEPPPGTEPLPPRPHVHPHVHHITRPPLMYHRAPSDDQSSYVQPVQYAAYNSHHVVPSPPPAVPQASTIISTTTNTSTGLSLMKNYNTDSETEDSDFDDTSSTESKLPAILIPPEDVQVVIDKMAAYVARNGDEFAEIVRAKNDPRFTFLEPAHEYHPYYQKLMQEKRGIDVNGTKQGKRKSSAPVSFSIKKLKEPDPILPKPALPYESSSEDESDKQERHDEPKDVPKPVPQPLPAVIVPPVVVYKIENPTPEPIVEIVKPTPKPVVIPKPVAPPNPVPIPKPIPDVKEEPKPVVVEMKPAPVAEECNKPQIVNDKKKVSESPVKEKRRYKERKKEYRSKSEVNESWRPEKKSVDREKRKDRDSERVKKRRVISKEMCENEIISLVDNAEELIDLTGDHSDTKGDVESEGDKVKQQERRRRAAEFLKKVGVDPTAAALPTTSLASAMVDTLESLRKKKAEEEEKRRKREKRRHRDRYDYQNGSERSHRKSKRRRRSSEDESDYDGKRRRRKKDKKHTTKNRKRRRRETDILGEDVDQPLNIDLTNTLKELRNSSPTKELVQDIDAGQQSLVRRDSGEEDGDGKRKDRRKKKEEREYSEGEWSSDSEQDSASSASRMEE